MLSVLREERGHCGPVVRPVDLSCELKKGRVG